MKNLILSLAVTFCSSLAFANSFSAYAEGDNLYVTIPTDGCNSYGVELITDGICRSDRLTKNYATECSGSLSVIGTQMYCGPRNFQQIFTLSLAESMVTPEAEVLEIRYDNETVTVKLK